MSPQLRRVLLGGILALLMKGVHGGPARSLTMDAEFSDDNITEFLMEDREDTYEESLDEVGSNPGVLGRLWTGFSSSLNLFGTGELEEKLNKFRTGLLSKVRTGVKDIQEIRVRQKRAHPIDTILSQDPKGYYSLSEVDANVNPNLRNFASPPNAISMEVFEHKNFVFWLVTEDYSIDNPGSLYVYMLDVVRNSLQRAQARSLGANKCVPVLKLDSFVEIICVETQGHKATDALRKGAGSGVYRITWANGLEVEFQRALKTQAAQDVAIWYFGSITFLAFANSYDSSRRTGEITSSVFKLQTTTLSGAVYTTYDNVEKASFGTKYAYGLETFRIVSRQFLAVANHRDDLGNVEIDSVIYIYDFHNERLKPFQRIRTSGARDWVAFSFVQGPSSEYFLAVANEYKIDKNGNKDYKVDSVIYKYDDSKYGEGKFVPFQCIRTNGARQWIVHQGTNGEFLLAVVNGQAGVFFYQYNGWRFVQTDFEVSGIGAEFGSFSYLSNTLNQLVLSVANPFVSSRPESYYIRFEYSNPLGKYHEDALAWCKSFSKTVATDGLSDLVRSVESATKVDDPRNFTRAITINGELRVTANYSSILNIIVLSQGPQVDIGFGALADLRKEIDEALGRLALVRSLLQAARRITSQVDLDGVRFSNVRIVCANGNIRTRCSVDDLIANTVNGVSTSFDNAIRIDQSFDIEDLNLADLVVANGGQITVEFISGPGLPRTPFSDIVTLTGNHNIFGTKTFNKLQANDLLVSGTVGGVRISSDNLLLTVTEQRITSEVTIQKLTASRIDLGTVNGRDFSTFLSNLVLKGANQAFTGPLVINGDLIAPSIRTLNPVTPLDPVTATKTALLHNTGETQFITGAHVVRELHSQQGITIEGLLNGISVPDDLYLRSSNEIVNRPVTFQDIVADMVTIDGMLGDVQVKNGELDLLLLNGDQVVSGRKIFNEITLLGHSTVDGNVAGHRLQDLTTNLAAEFIKGINAGRELRGSVNFNGGLTVLDDLVDGVSISRILNSGITLDDTRIDNRIIFDGPVQVEGDLRITGTLNGVDIADYALKDGTHTFTGEITFTTDLVNRGNVDAGTVNGYDLSSLASRVMLLNTDQTITGDITLHNPEFSDLSVSGEVIVSGINLNDVVSLNSDALITGQKTFTTVKVLSSVKAGGVDVGQFGTVDGVVISDLFFGDSLRKTGTTVQNLIGRSLNVVIAETATGTNLANLERRVVYKDRPESIDGSLKFTGPVTVKDLTFSGNFDGVSSEDYSSGWLLKTGVQTLTGHNFFLNLNSGDVTFTGKLIQGTDLALLQRNTAKIDEATTLENISFDELRSMSEVSLDGKIQGFKLKDEALLSNGVRQTVTGIKTFWDTIHYTGEFNIDGNVLVKNNRDDDTVSIDVGGLCTDMVTINKPVNIQEIIVDGDVFFGGNVNVTGSFNNLGVLTLANEFWLSDVPNYIPSITHFSSVEIVPSANLILEGLINGVDIRSIWENVLKKECDQQTITGEFFIESLSVDRLETDTVTNSNDDLGLNALLDVLLKDGDQVISDMITLPKLETRDSIILDGTLNNLRVDTDFVQYNKRATITARKTFQSLTIHGDLSVEDKSTVQGVDVSELAKQAVKPDVDGSGNCFIPGTTTFKGLRFQDGTLEVGGTVDGVHLNSSRVLLKSVDQEVHGRITLNGQTSLETLSTFTVLDDKFNDISLSRLKDFTVRSNRPNTIRASVTFVASPTFSSVTISNHLINGYNITDLGLCLSGNHIVNNMGDQFHLVLRAAQDAKDMLAEKATELWYFKEIIMPQVHGIVPVTLTASTLVSHEFDTLVGLDMDAGLVYTYRIERDFPLLYNPIPIMKPLTAAGLSRNLLATCGKEGMAEFANGLRPTSDFRKIPLENGEDHGYGHLHALVGNAGVKVAFGIHHCKDLVSFKLNDGRLCLAVVDHLASSTVMCGTPDNGFYLLNYLGTNRAVKGAWMDLGIYTYLLIVEHELGYEPGYLKVFKHDAGLDKMIMVAKVELHGADDVDVIIQGTGAVIAVSARENVLSNSSVTILTGYLEDDNLVLEVLQTIHVNRVHHSSFSVMPTGEVGLFIQTALSIKLYLWKCVEFSYAREIRTALALWPSSEAFLYDYNGSGTGTLLIAHSAFGILDRQTQEQIEGRIETKLFAAQYRGLWKEPLYYLE